MLVRLHGIAELQREDFDMGRDAQRTVEEIEQTREELAVKVDELFDRAKVEAAEIGKKLAVAGGVLAGVLVLGWLAKKRVES